MTLSSTAAVPTVNGSRYVQQLCKHWAHSLHVEQEGSTGIVVFPRDARGADWPDGAKITLVATEHVLNCSIAASAAGQLEGLKVALARHLDRFAYREAPLPFDWQDA